MRSMRVAHVITSLGRGGAERQLVNLIAATCAEVEHLVVTLGPPHHLADELRALGVTVHTLNSPRWRELPQAVGRLYTALQHWRPDIVHTWLTQDALVGRVAAWLRGTPVVSSLQALLYVDIPHQPLSRTRRWKRAVLQQLDRWTARLSQAAIVGCSATVSAMAQQKLGVPAARTRTIYNSVPQQAVRQPPHGAPLVLSVGRLVPEKGHQFVIDAWTQVRQHHPQAQLWIVGSGWYQPELERMIEQRRLQGSVQMLGLRADVDQLLAQATLFILPTLWEGFSLAILEAMTHGVPAISSDLAVVREIIEHRQSGWLVPPGDSTAIAEALNTLLSDSAERERLAQAGYQQIQQRFNSAQTAQNWLELYQQVSHEQDRQNHRAAPRAVPIVQRRA